MFVDRDTTPTVAIETQGCKLNQADSLMLSRMFAEAGFRYVDAEQPADVYVVNSCTVTHIADRKARHSLRAARRRNPKGTIVATGCYAQRSPDELRQIDEIDLVIGNADKSTLVRQVLEWLGLPDNVRPIGEAAGDVKAPAFRTRAMVKIQEGCDQVCAYCIVPKVRGRERSIPADRVIEEVRSRVAEGYREVVLTGTQLGTYGFEWSSLDLRELIQRVLSETDVSRLRVSSLQPQEIDDDLLDCWLDKRLCPHFHLPLQSGSDFILKPMRRRYTSAQYAEAVTRIRERLPGASITADVIVGFPGESDDDFQRTYALCDAIGFADMHVFPYSIRPGTSAAYLEAQVAPEVKARRARKLLNLAKRQSLEFRRGLVGETRSVLWESGISGRKDGDECTWSGLTEDYIRVSAVGRPDLENEITSVRLLSADEDGVRALVLDPVKP